MLTERQRAWHIAQAESLTHDATCDVCVVRMDDLTARGRCSEGQRLYAADQSAMVARIFERTAGVC